MKLYQLVLLFFLIFILLDFIIYKLALLFFLSNSNIFPVLIALHIKVNPMFRLHTQDILMSKKTYYFYFFNVYSYYQITLATL